MVTLFVFTKAGNAVRGEMTEERAIELIGTWSNLGWAKPTFGMKAKNPLGMTYSFVEYASVEAMQYVKKEQTPAFWEQFIQ